MHLGATALRRTQAQALGSLLLHVLQTKMGKTSKDANDSKRKRKRVAVESSSDDDESEQDLEEVTGNVLDLETNGNRRKRKLTWKLLLT